MDEFYVRAALVKSRVDRLVRESRSIARGTLTDSEVDRLEAISSEVNLLVDNIATIREEQLIASLPTVAPRKKRWWRIG